MDLTKRIGRLIPYPFIGHGRKIVHFGLSKCHVCNARVRKFGDTGYGYAVLERLQVVGGLKRRADRCPVCHSSSRERLIWFWLSNAGTLFRFDEDISIAHFAPEKGLSKRLSSSTAHTYQAYDYEPGRYRHLNCVLHADLAKLQIEDDSVDLLICNHVLEHVRDFSSALGEILRVLSPGGTAILQVPIALKLSGMIELPPTSTEAERIELVGQNDHLRLFTEPDYCSALASAGFELELYDAFEDDAQRATAWSLDPFEKLYLCKKPLGPA